MIEFLFVLVFALLCWLFFYLGRIYELGSYNRSLNEELDKELEELKHIEKELKKAKGGAE